MRRGFFGYWANTNLNLIYLYGFAMRNNLLYFGSTPEDDPKISSTDHSQEAAEDMSQSPVLLGAKFSAYPGQEELPRKGNAVNGLTEGLLSQWLQRLSDLQSLAKPLLQSRAVQRLTGVTFLGVLSPRFRDVIDSPLWPASQQKAVSDGFRYDHTLGVAIVALDLARRLDFSERGQRYAVAWGLTHDISTWPLSHTSEPAFTSITGISARNLRAGILLSDPEIPERYRLAPILCDLGIDPIILVSLFDRNAFLADEELAILKQVVNSPITPDTIEGMWRCGVVFDSPVIHPNEVISAFCRRRGTACLERRGMSAVMDFWRGKSLIYERFINREDVILWESAWTAALQRSCSGRLLAESLELSEDDLVNTVKRQGLPTGSGVIRYKEPQEYIIKGALDAMPPEPPVSELWRVLRREPVGKPHE